MVLLTCLSMLVSVASSIACPPGFVAGLERCFTSTAPASKARECVNLCAAKHQDAAPACITSTEENAIAHSLTSSLGRAAWIGRFRNKTECYRGGCSGQTNEDCPCTKWEQCVSDELPGLVQLWENGHSGTAVKGNDCLRAWPDGTWYESWCDPHGYYDAPCICAWPASVRPAAATWLEEWGPLDLTARHEAARNCFSFAARSFILAPLVMIILLFLMFHALRVLWKSIKGARSPQIAPPEQATALESPSAAMSRQDQQKGMAARLDAAQKSAQRLRLSITLSCFVIGWSCFTLGFTPMICIAPELDASAVIGPYPMYFILGCFGFLTTALAILPTDTILIRVLCFMVAAGFTVFLVSFGLVNRIRNAIAGEMPTADVVIQVAGHVNEVILLAVVLRLWPVIIGLLPGPFKRFYVAPRAALQRLWVGLRAIVIVMMGIANFLEALNGLAHNPRFLIDDPSSGWANVFMPPIVTLLALSFTPRNRGRIHRWLGQLGSKGAADQEAATVAAMLGGGSAHEALQQGARRFRALMLSSLTEHDLMSNTDTNLFERTMKVGLGETSGFISHSWSDAGPAKFAALHRWRADHRKATGEDDPTLWLGDRTWIKHTRYVSLPLAHCPLTASILDPLAGRQGLHRSDQHQGRFTLPARLSFRLPVNDRAARHVLRNAAVVRP